MNGIDVQGPKVLFHIFGVIPVSETTFNSWLIIAAVFFLCLFLTHKMRKDNPSTKQVIAEKLVEMLYNLVEQTMGPNCLGFAPYIGTLFTFSIFGSLISLICLRPVTADVNTTLGWALITFFMVQINAIRKKKLGGYLKSFAEPVAVILPLNIISEFSNIISLTFRHFGNIIAGVVITKLLYAALGALSQLLLRIPIPILQVGLPAFLSLYFDLFTGFMQAFIFSMLTMVFISNAMEE